MPKPSEWMVLLSCIEGEKLLVGLEREKGKRKKKNKNKKYKRERRMISVESKN